MIRQKHKTPMTPQVAVGAIVIKENRILLVRRNKEPSRGEWAIPGGSVKLGETLQEAVEREILEETGLIIKAKDPVHTFDLIERDHREQIRFHYVIVDLLAELMGGELHASDDALDARWFGPEEVEATGVSESTKTFLKKIRFIR